MTTATRETIERVRRLSAAEVDELAAWLRDHRARTEASAASRPEPAPVSRPDFAADLRESWGDAPPTAQNAVLALRAEERF